MRRFEPAYAALAVLCLVRLSIAGEIITSPTDTLAIEKKTGRAILKAEPQSFPLPDFLILSGAEETRPYAIEPFFIRPLGNIESGRNDSNPQWSPHGTLLAFERSIGDKKEIRITRPDGSTVQIVYNQPTGAGTESGFFFPGVYEETSYNAGITWSPAGDRFVFMSNGGEGNYDLYLQEIGSKAAKRLTRHREKDGHPHWSPIADRIVFVSGRTGNGDLYLADLQTRAITRLTADGKTYLYPQWSPNGKKIVAMTGSNENHDIVLIQDAASGGASARKLTAWPHDDLRPVWSPDGKKIAFYSNFNPDDDPKIWSIIVVAADGSDPTAGEGLAAKVAATDVVPDVEAGPAWLPDSRRIVYVKNDRQEFNPLSIADIEEKKTLPVRTSTRMNHDVSCSQDGLVAFRAQVDQWDQIYIMKLEK